MATPGPLPSVTVLGTNLAASPVTVGSDATGDLLESWAFLNTTASSVSSKATWTTHLTVRFGVDKRAVGNWFFYLFPVYGSPLDTQGTNGRNRPYYSRTTLVAAFEDGTDVNLDFVSSAAVIANGHGIPPTVVEWDPDTGSVVSVESYLANAFVQNARIQSNPNHTGFSEDGEYCLRYDHTIENEGRSTFYVMAGWGSKWTDPDGSILRGDIPRPGQRWGFSTGEEGIFSRVESLGEKNYPIDHIDIRGSGGGAWVADHLALDSPSNWKNNPRETRGISGITPFCLNIESRAGTGIERDFGMVWLLKHQAAVQLQMWPSPLNPHSPNVFLYNYDSTAERGKGFLVGALAVLFRALNTIAAVRTGDPEALILRDACGLRAVEIFDLLSRDFDNNSWIEGTTFQSPWMWAHYFQGLLLFGETIKQLTGQDDPKVQLMLATIAAECQDNTLFYTNGQPHPRDANTTYTGGVSGWALDYIKNNQNPGLSNPITFQTLMVIGYEWLKRNGLKLGAKQDAIIAQSSDINYKWELGTASQRLFTSIAWSASGDMVPNARLARRATIPFEGFFTLRINPTISGGGGLFRIGTAIVADDTKSIGDAIAVGPYINAMGDKAFSVVRGDHFKQPFTVTLDQSRTLDGTEDWRCSIRKDPTQDPVMTFAKSDGSIEIDGSNNPILVFTPAKFANVPIETKDAVYLYDLEMNKGGKFETYAIDEVTIRMDLTRVETGE